jgi:hypothetical protein
MTRLILTSLSGADLIRSDLADVVVFFPFRFVWGPLPSPDELATYLAARSDQHTAGTHWATFSGRWPDDAAARKHLGLVEFCRHCETVELWFDPNPNDQLLLVWLIDTFRSYPEILERLKFRIVDFDLIGASAEELGRWRVLAVDIARHELETASMAWQAWRAPTPEACFDLLSKDLSALPLLKPALLELLEELPSGATGLGATEMRLLELIASGYANTNPLFHLRTLRQRYVFNDMETGSLLEGIAHGSRPAVAGLDDELRTLEADNHRGRQDAYQRSRLSLTEFGKAIVAHREDFSRHNPIDRWWGGTHLTNDGLWRWNPTLVRPSAVTS